MFLLVGWGELSTRAEAPEIPSDAVVTDQQEDEEAAGGEGPFLKEDSETRFEMLPEKTQTPRFQYQSKEGRDPFVSFVSPHDKDMNHFPPLQRVAVSELKLIGVARSSGRVSAMLQTPDGKTYPVSPGTRVGSNRGRVGAIGPESVTIEEPYLNIFGRTALRQIVMKLYVKKEE